MGEQGTPPKPGGSGGPRSTVAEDSVFEGRPHQVDSVEAARVRGAVESAMFGPALGSDSAPKLGRFSLLERVGAGGMGMVYAAWDPQLDRKVAIKVVRSDLAGPEATGRLLDEARTLAKLRHPNVVTIHDAGETGGRVWLAMEFVSDTVQQWLGGDPEPSEILDVFAQAGRGLIAAHRAGIIHRDFKPSNVLLDESRRAIVADFGLARSQAHVDEGATGRAGTPYFMSPEQFDGRALDARSDQFSFCVCLYDSLFGQHPFEGDSALERQIAALEGRFRRPSRLRDAPMGLLATLARGLEHDPGRRFDDMEALLDALIDRPRRRRRWAVGSTVAAGGLLAGAAASWGVAPDPPGPCAGARDEFAQVWSPQREREVVRAFEGAGLAYAADASRTLVAELDAYAEAWTRMRVEACEATFVRGAQSERLLDRRMACLDDRRADAGALVELLEGADAATVRASVQAVQRLPSVEPCADDAVVSTHPALPEDPALAEEVREVQSALASVRALLSTKRTQDALAQVEALLARAEATGWPSVHREALHVDGVAAMQTGQYARALRNLERALFMAEAQGNDEAVVRSAAALLLALSDEDPTSANVATWFQLGRAVNARLGERADLGIALWKGRGAIMARNQDFDAAAAAWGHAAQLARDSLPAGHIRHAELATSLGGVALSQGDPERALRHFEEAMAILEAAVGPHHPLVGNLHNNFGAVYFGNREYAKAREAFARAVEVEEKVAGADAVTLADTLYNLALAESKLGNAQEAERTFRRIAPMYVEQHGPEHPYVAAVHEELGILAREREDFDASRAEFERALAIKRKALGPEHPEVAGALKGLGYAEQGAGELERALALFEQSATIIIESLGEDHERSANARARVARVEVDLGRLAQARDHAAQALATLDALGDRAEPGVAAEARFTLARATWERDPTAAMGLAERALGESVPGVLREEIEAWIGERE